MIRRVIIPLGFLLMVTLLTACGGAKAPSGGKSTGTAQESGGKSSTTRFVTVGTGATGGSYYPVGVGMAKVWSEKLPGIQATAEATGGANENMSLIGEKKITLGFAVTKNANDALNGRPPFKQKVNAVIGWHLFDTPLHIVTLKKSGINTVADLKGKRVAIGTAGSGVNTIAVEVLQAYGIGEKDFSPAYMGWDESADALGDGMIDATMITSAIPSGAIQGLAAKHDITLVAADEEKINAMPPGSYLPTTLPAGTYKGQDKDTVLFNLPAYAWFSPDEDEELVYQLTKAVMENKSYLETVHPMSKYISLVSQREAEALGVQVHPGAVRYAKEVGKW